MQIFVFLQPMQRQKKMVFLILEHCSCWGVKQKKHKKNHQILAFKPLCPYFKKRLKNIFTLGTYISYKLLLSGMIFHKMINKFNKMVKNWKNWVYFTGISYKLLHLQNNKISLSLTKLGLKPVFYFQKKLQQQSDPTRNWK